MERYESTQVKYQRSSTRCLKIISNVKARDRITEDKPTG